MTKTRTHSLTIPPCLPRFTASHAPQINQPTSAQCWCYSQVTKSSQLSTRQSNRMGLAVGFSSITDEASVLSHSHPNTRVAAWQAVPSRSRDLQWKRTTLCM